MEDTSVVEVGHPSSNVSGHLDSHRPGQLSAVIVEQLLQRPTIDKLWGVGERERVSEGEHMINLQDKA